MKKSFYFSHDTNAASDPKILQMLGVYGACGYGWFWMIIELLAEQSDYKLCIGNKYAYNAIALKTHCEAEQIKQFIADCINEFTDSNGAGLFASDGGKIWSESLLDRMLMRDQKSAKAAEAANIGWKMRKQSEGDANAMPAQCNEMKLNKSKQTNKRNERKYDIIVQRMHDIKAGKPVPPLNLEALETDDEGIVAYISDPKDDSGKGGDK